MRIGVARETVAGERRVALVPETAGKLAAAGFEVIVEPGAGAAASFPDDLYAAAGSSVAIARLSHAGGNDRRQRNVGAIRVEIGRAHV